jgi:hypothetical protein
MTDIGRGLSLEQARQIAGDATSAASVLTRLANGYPEVWAVLLTNPATPGDLRVWLENAMKPKPAEQPVVARLAPAARDDTATVAPLSSRNAPRKPAATQPARQEIAPQILPPVEKISAVPARKARRKRGRTATVLGTLAGLVVLATFSVAAMAQALPPGQIVTQELATAPSLAGGWTYDLVKGQENDNCIEWSFQSFAQDVVVVLSQYAKEKDGCEDLEEPPLSYLALVNSETGEEIWRRDLAKVLPWTAEWTKELTDFTGLNEIVLMMTDTPDDPDADSKKTLVPFSRLDGSVTDPAIAGNKNDPTSVAPELTMGRVPDTDKYVIVGFPASEEEGKISYRRVKKMATSSKWTTKVDIEPIHGNPVVGNRIILGAEYDDEPQAVALEDGKLSIWDGPAGGKMLNVAGSYVHVRGDGTSGKYSNTSSQDGKAETSDCDAECVVLTGVSPSGRVLWERKVPGYAVARDTAVATNADRGEYSTIFVLSSDRAFAMPLNAKTGQLLWDMPQEWGSFEIAKTQTPQAFFTYSTSTDADHTDGLQMRSIRSGEVLGDFELPNNQTRIDATSSNFVYVVDEPDRQAVVEDLEDGDSASSTSDDDDSDKSEQKRECLWGINLRTTQKAWSWECNGYQHVAVAAGNWVVIDKTPGAQTMRPLRTGE